MITSDSDPGERVVNVRFPEGEEVLCVELVDGRTISVPLAWFPRLLHATPEQRNNWQIIGAGFGIHWPDVDEDISVEGMLHGVPVRRPRSRSPEAKTHGVHEPPSERIEPTRGNRRARGGRGGARG